MKRFNIISIYKDNYSNRYDELNLSIKLVLSVINSVFLSSNLRDVIIVSRSITTYFNLLLRQYSRYSCTHYIRLIVLLIIIITLPNYCPLTAIFQHTLHPLTTQTNHKRTALDVVHASPMSPYVSYALKLSNSRRLTVLGPGAVHRVWGAPPGKGHHQAWGTF